MSRFQGFGLGQVTKEAGKRSQSTQWPLTQPLHLLLSVPVLHSLRAAARKGLCSKQSRCGPRGRLCPCLRSQGLDCVSTPLSIPRMMPQVRWGAAPGTPAPEQLR